MYLQVIPIIQSNHTPTVPLHLSLTLLLFYTLPSPIKPSISPINSPQESLNPPLMGEEASSSPLQFLTQITHHSYSSDLELDESDVFYSSPPDSPFNSPNNQINHHYRLTSTQIYGLSSLLSDGSSQVTSPQPIPCCMERNGPNQSAPVAVPAWQGRSTMEYWEEELGFDDDEGGEMVPPHVMVARSHLTKACSVLEGVGRTLKGRDLRRVRNAVWQKTGFLDL